MPIDEGLLLVLRSNTLADAEPDLGATLLRSFLKVLGRAAQTPARVLCLGTGVYLTTQGSPVVEELQALVQAGARVSSCATCLDYYGRRERLLVGEVGTMQDAVDAMLRATRVLQP